ncbi:MFS transporter [Amycolatopsis sp. FDAARGOS 1241]|uniref:MFS transporter n=1 Tax=Amycolatopsis sp. FDAARGOS 1241 TaxID=2778070 RepID=UPI001952525F|nr:MFS transporter [Amycolatopsis sp. FDAARGOS 1241]QRP46724.1 MFS transporter [Amycolatopsis sp. FDAARGOS 1241]
MSTRVSLRRDRDFRLVWTGETISTLGSAVAGTALPLTALLVLHATTFEVAALSAVAWAPWLVVALPAGAWVDRWRKRRVMLVCNVVSALAFAAVPVAYVTGLLSMPFLLAAALVGGVAKVFFSLAYRGYLPALVPKDRLLEANVKLQGSESAAQVAGPGLAGVLAAAAGPVTGVLANAVSFAISVLCLHRVRKEEPRPEPRKTRLRTEIAEGLRFLAKDPYLRTLVAAAAIANLALDGYAAIQVVFLVDDLHTGATATGVVLALAEAGGVAGAPLAARLARKAGTARAFLLCEGLAAPAMLLGPFAAPRAGLVLFILSGTGVAAGIVGSNVLAGTFRQEYCPPGRYGRITASSAVVNYGTIPLGALLGGVLGEALGVRETLFAMAAVQLGSLTVLLTSPLRRHRDFPAAAAAQQPG